MTVYYANFRNANIDILVNQICTKNLVCTCVHEHAPPPKLILGNLGNAPLTGSQVWVPEEYSMQSSESLGNTSLIGLIP